MAAPSGQRVPFPANNPLVISIEVDSNDNAYIPDTGIDAFVPGDNVQFKSNHADTAIQFVGRSPFTHPAPGETYFVGNMSPVLAVINPGGRCAFLCGRITPTGFEEWGGGGSHTPTGGNW
jgi:hypothetical protein